MADSETVEITADDVATVDAAELAGAVEAGPELTPSDKAFAMLVGINLARRNAKAALLERNWEGVAAAAAAVKASAAELEALAVEQPAEE